MKAAIIIYAQKKIPNAHHQHYNVVLAAENDDGQNSTTCCDGLCTVYEKQNCITATEGNYQLHSMRNLNFIFLCVEAQLLKRNSP